MTLSGAATASAFRCPKVDWRLTELDRRTAEVMVRVVAEEFRRLGLGEVRGSPGWPTPTGPAT